MSFGLWATHQVIGSATKNLVAEGTLLITSFPSFSPPLWNPARLVSPDGGGFVSPWYANVIFSAAWLVSRFDPLICYRQPGPAAAICSLSCTSTGIKTRMKLGNMFGNIFGGNLLHFFLSVSFFFFFWTNREFNLKARRVKWYLKREMKVFQWCKVYCASLLNKINFEMISRIVRRALVFTAMIILVIIFKVFKMWTIGSLNSILIWWKHFNYCC